MVRLQLRRMPGGGNRYRCYFDVRSDVKGIEMYFVGDMQTLKDFLVSKLDLSQSAASRLAIEAESSGSSYCELPTHDEAEIKILMRTIERESKLAAEQQSKGTVQPAQASQ
jgi:hypothetical protein